MVEEIFKGKKNGFFLDLAATNGLMENNTYVLEKFFQWKGIAIEANNFFFSKLKKNRNCKCINEVVSGNKSEVKFLEHGPTGGIIGESYDNNYVKRGKLIKKLNHKISTKKTKSLEKILKENNAPKVIDYFSLDVEGAETDIIENFNFLNYKFLSITIERPTPKINKILFKKNYVFVKNFKVDSFIGIKVFRILKPLKKRNFFKYP